MSSNIEISFEVHNVNYAELDDEKRTAAIEAAKQFVNDHGMEDDGIEIEFIGKDRYLCAYTPEQITVSRARQWIDHATTAWEEMAKRVLGPNCEPRVEVDWVDFD